MSLKRTIQEVLNKEDGKTIDADIFLIEVKMKFGNVELNCRRL